MFVYEWGSGIADSLIAQFCGNFKGKNAVLNGRTLRFQFFSTPTEAEGMECISCVVISDSCGILNVFGIRHLR